MKILFSYLIVFILFSFSSCKKLIEDKQKDALLELITSGQWHVESFTEGTSSITTEFQGYNFQFTEDGSVYGNLGTQIIPGTWSGDISNYSISSNFPDAPDPVKKLNGTWRITDSAVDFVVAEMQNVQGITVLHLRKNS
jgi:hypothetical protein